MKHSAAVAVLALCVSAMSRAADDRLLDALRANDTAGVKTLLQGGADPNVRDGGGVSALMYATLYASLGEMRLLLKHGADINAANGAGATALMWATYDADKVSALIENGADVNARTRNDTTALVVAIRLGNPAAVRALIAHGADLETNTVMLLTEAHAQGSADVEQALRDAGLGATAGWAARVE